MEWEDDLWWQGVVGPKRLDNTDFLQDFHQIYHNGNAQKYKKRREMNPNDPAVEIQEMEVRIKEFVLDSLKQVNQGTGNSNVELDDIKKMIQMEVHKKMRGVNRVWSDVNQMKWDSHAFNRMQTDQSFMSSTSMLQDGDNKEGMIKAQLLEGLQETVIADNLGSKPIEGVDMPFKSTAFSAKGKLMMVEELGVDPAAD